jgi:molybdopterin-guanine dinucleotide biosynthesis protein A
MEPPGVVGVVLAGGRSSRMGGQDKCLASLAGRPVIAQVIARLGPQVATLALNANAEPSRFASFGLPIIADRVEGQGGSTRRPACRARLGEGVWREHPLCRHGRLRYAVSAR